MSLRSKIGRVMALGLAALMLGCAGTPAKKDPNPLVRWDPIEPFNRHVYRLNARMDKWVVLPVVHVYDYLPGFVRAGVHNFFTNFNEVTTLGNSILQLAPKKAAVTTGRIVVNSTVGIGGLFDWASRWGIPDYDEDLGQTLGHWRVPAGPYLVLPVLGPSSLRDGIGLAGDRGAIWGLQVLALGDLSSVLSGFFPVEIVSTRSSLDFRYGELGPFEYDLVRYMYLEYRASVVDE